MGFLPGSTQKWMYSHKMARGLKFLIYCSFYVAIKVLTNWAVTSHPGEW